MGTNIDNKDDDFLDNLMGDLMGVENKEDKPAEESSHSFVKEGLPLEVGETSVKKSSPLLKTINRDRDKGAETSQEVGESKPRKPGLLSRINTGNKNKEVDISKEEVSVDKIAEQAPKVEEVISTKEVSVDDYYKKESGASTGGNSLLDRMKKRRQETSDIVDKVTEVGDVEEQEEEEEQEEKLGVFYEEGSSEDPEEDSDSFDDLLNDLNGDEVYKAPTELDSSVETPLETRDMRDIKVTPDGKSLADMLIGMRSGNKSIVQKVAKVRNQEEIASIGAKKFTDDRYLKHAKVIDKEAEENKKKIALSNKFLQRNAKFTENEKIIMKNLGLDNKELSKIMGSKKLSKKEKARILGLGRYGAEKHFKGRRYRTTVGDTALLEYLVKFKYANTRILRWIKDEPQSKTWRKLNRLKNNGLVESKSLIGVPDLWGTTPSGTALSGYALKPGLRPMPKIPTISATMGVNYIAACLWFNTVNVLNLDDFPAHNKTIALQDDGVDRVRGENLVSELEIRSSLGKEINPSSTTMRTLGDERLYDIISANVAQAVAEWEAGGKVGDGPECSLGNEYMWVLYPTSQLTLSYHVPDLVVKRERGPNGEPKSIAVEVERYAKTNDKYDKIMLAYKLNEHLYEQVVWLTPDDKVARALHKAAENVGFDRYSILPIITKDGIYDKQDIWLI